MRLLTFDNGKGDRLGAIIDDETVLDVAAASEGLPLSLHSGDMVAFIRAGQQARDALAALLKDPPDSARLALSRVTLRAPITRPSRNVFCVGRNYLAHVAEGDRARNQQSKVPEWPQFFTKPPQAVIGPDDAIPNYAHITECLDYEVELVAIIGREGKNISESDALSHVFGLTIGNDITARDIQRRHEQWFKGKGLDRTCPLGPWIVTIDELDPGDIELSLSVDGVQRQKSRTSNMIFSVPTIISQLSLEMTLYPGDIIMTGTPEGVGFAMSPPACLRSGNVIEATIEGIGTLRNSVE
jgi:2-keto-4-pentenoate hydratase/2-oxohepta-3-ene-1,7-dioic acid hydratase in catechol pathway